jgi:hypothetical protein
LVAGPGGRDNAPQPPFVFREEDSRGSSPKIVVRDARGTEWSVKFGPEVHAEVFAPRLLWAVGYKVEPTYFVRSGKIDSVGALGRAEPLIDRGNGNAFTNARLELRTWDTWYQPGMKWNLTDSPFRGTPQLAGLRIMSMLVSNWDVKDSNFAVVQQTLPGGRKDLQYLIDDWGATMGKWGDYFTREKWDCRGYASQSDDFVKGVHGDVVEFGYLGKQASVVKSGIRTSDVAWLMQYLGRVTNAQIRDALKASGADEKEADCFTKAIRARIDALRRVARPRATE